MAQNGASPITDFQPEQSHVQLGPELFGPVAPASFPKLTARYRNQRWAERVGLGALSASQWEDHFGRFEPFPGSFEQPLALRYHGHQFQVYNAELGDGRGFLFAQMRDPENGHLLDFGTKGTGQTPWSRGGDGRLTLKGAVREILATELLGASGVETSQTFAVFETGEELARNDEPSPARGAVLTRLNHSHIRIGTFQRLSHLGKTTEIERVRDYAIKTYFPEIWHEDGEERTVNFLLEVTERVARLGAQYIAAGFVHGVLNTDNINITGESFDYGPWRFLPRYDPAFTAAYFDQNGLYAFARQPEALAWNLTRLAETLLPFASSEKLEPALNQFSTFFQKELAQSMLWKLGLMPDDGEPQPQFVGQIFAFMSANDIGYEQFFFDWYGGQLSAERAAQSRAAPAYQSESFAPVKAFMATCQPRADLALDHAYFAQTKPATLLIEEVEALWAPIAERDDWTPFQSKLDDIAQRRQAYQLGLGAPGSLA